MQLCIYSKACSQVFETAALDVMREFGVKLIKEYKTFLHSASVCPPRDMDSKLLENVI